MALGLLGWDVGVLWGCWGSPRFWGDPGPPSRRQEEAERRLPRRRLLLLARHEPVLRWVRDCDHALYQGLVEILVPDVLRPIPSEPPNPPEPPTPSMDPQNPPGTSITRHGPETPSDRIQLYSNAPRENLHPQTSTQTPKSSLWPLKGPPNESPRPPKCLFCLPFPGALTQAIRNFAKSLESWLGNAMVSMPEEMVRVKVGFGGGFGGTAGGTVGSTVGL